MAATVGSLFATHAERIEEIINKNVDVILPGVDPVWMDNVVTSQGVAGAGEIGRDMEIIRVFQGGLTGVLEQGAPRDDFALFGDDQDTVIKAGRLHKQGLDNVFPDPLEGPNQTPYRLVIPLRSMVANIMFTLGELQADALPATIGQIVAPKLEGFARNMAVTLCNYWYINENDNYQLSNLGATSGTTTLTWTSNVATFQPTNEATHRYHVGMRVDIYPSSGATIRNADAVYVTDVDHLTNTVELTAVANTGTWQANVDTSDIVVLRRTGTAGTAGAQKGIAGINSWLRTGGDTSGTGEDYLLGSDAVTSHGSGTSAIDVNVYSEHKSMGYDMEGKVMTEHTLRQLLRRFHAAKNPYGYFIDTLIASDGVWLAYEATKIGRERIDRSSRIGGTTPEGYSSNANFGGFSFQMDGRNYTGYTSCYIEDGTIYGLRMGGSNWKRYVPPDVRNTKPFDRNSSFIPFRFVASALTGLGTNQLPIFSNDANDRSRVTEGSQMPGWLRMQLAPDQFCGMKIVNCATDKIYASTTALSLTKGS